MPYLILSVYLLVSLLSFLLIYFKASISLLQQLSALLLAVLIFIFSKFNTKENGFKLSNKLKLIFLFNSSLFVQLLVLATGGIYSPFLILLHLFTLATSLLLSLGSSISFLLLSILILISNIYFNPSIFKIFQDDPGSAILYFVSFVVVIPLAHLLINTYNLKDKFLDLLKKEVNLSRQKTESVFSGVNELVVVTDVKLKIISANEALLKVLFLPEEALLGKFMLEAVPFKDDQGQPPTLNSVSIDQTINDKTTRIIKGFSLLEKGGTKLIPVSIQIRPILGQDAKVNQLMFVISENYTSDDATHSDLDQAKNNSKQVVEQIKQDLMTDKLDKTEQKLEFFLKSQADIVQAAELEDHPINQKTGFVDVAFLCKQLINQKQILASSLNVNLTFNIDRNEVGERALLEYQDQKVDFKVSDTSPFSSIIDEKWLSVLIEKLLDICLLTSDPATTVNLYVRRNGQINNVIITANSVNLSQIKPEYLFTAYYPNLVSTTNLKLGSGLEGYIAKIILFQMGLKLETHLSLNSPNLMFELNIPKNPVFGT